jgi:hypothetical protein
MQVRIRSSRPWPTQSRQQRNVGGRQGAMPVVLGDLHAGGGVVSGASVLLVSHIPTMAIRTLQESKSGGTTRG